MAGLNIDNQSAPPHALMNESPARTDYTVRFGLTLLPARYVLRGLFSSIMDSSAPELLKRYTGDPIRDKLFANPLFKRIDNHFSTIKRSDILGAHTHLTPESSEAERVINEALNTTEKGRELKSFLGKQLRQYGAGRETGNTLHYALTNPASAGSDRIALTDMSKSRIRSAMSNMVFETLYDNSLGLGSLWMTLKIRERVLHDMHSVFSEAVSYELGKDPSAITDQDIFSSPNEIIQATAENYTNKRNQRLGISTLPILKNIPSLRALKIGDVAIGAWGLFWAYDTWGREPTMLDLFSDFVNDKLHPKFGIGDQVRSSDIINLYQNYALKFRPDSAFTNVANSDISEGKLWLQSEGIFREIAQLMNESYNYKHKPKIDPETGFPAKSASFQLPKFVYLLGHGLLDIHKPDWTIAFVRIANEYGMEAVKEVERAYRRNMDLDSVLKKYPVSLELSTEESSRTPKRADAPLPKPETDKAEAAAKTEADARVAITSPNHQVVANSVVPAAVVSPQTVALAAHPA